MSMGDRIAVMNKGVLQQVGEPHDIYANPNNLFVAQFIGSPGMNFLHCHAETKNGDLALRMVGDNSLVSIPAHLQTIIRNNSEPDRELILGIRPEDIKLSMQQKENHLQMKVYVEEKMGSYKIVDLQYGDEIIRVRTSPHIQTEMEQPVYITFDMDRLRLFDRETEQSIMNREN
jgi:ABC-type sugar transport system ATPase subunit